MYLYLAVFWLNYPYLGILSPAVGDIANTPRPSIRLFSFRTVTRKRIDVFSRNFAGTCTMSELIFQYFHVFFVFYAISNIKKNLV